MMLSFHATNAIPLLKTLIIPFQTAIWRRKSRVASWWWIRL